MELVRSQQNVCRSIRKVLDTEPLSTKVTVPPRISVFPYKKAGARLKNFSLLSNSSAGISRAVLGKYSLPGLNLNRNGILRLSAGPHHNNSSETMFKANDHPADVFVSGPVKCSNAVHPPCAFPHLFVVTEFVPMRNSALAETLPTRILGGVLLSASVTLA